MFYTNFFIRLFRFNNRALRKHIIGVVLKLEHGDVYSKTLRVIYETYYDISIGMYSYGGCFSEKNIARGTVIGRYCSFGPNVFVFSGNHPLSHISMHPFFYNPGLSYVKKDLIPRTNVRFGHDVWVGANAVFLPPVSSVGNGAVIGACSVVTKNVPPFAIVAGNPARILRYRFSKELIEKITQSAWWDKNICELEKNLEVFLHPFEEKV